MDESTRRILFIKRFRMIGVERNGDFGWSCGAS